MSRCNGMDAQQNQCLETSTGPHQPLPHRCWFTVEEYRPMTGALLTDPRFRSPTRVTGTLRPWVQQYNLENGAHVAVDGPQIAVKRVAAMGEADENSKLVLRPSSHGHSIELPMVYLSTLWPQSMPLETSIVLDRNERLEVALYGCRATVVLFGVTQ